MAVLARPQGGTIHNLKTEYFPIINCTTQIWCAFNWGRKKKGEREKITGVTCGALTRVYLAG